MPLPKRAKRQPQPQQRQQQQQQQRQCRQQEQNPAFELPLNRILLSQAVVNAVHRWAPSFKPTHGRFKRAPKPQLPLFRMDQMMTNRGRPPPPIEVRPHVLIDGVLYYTLLGGRHRLARAIILNQPTILARLK
jgi:hypothetical protein